jgi:Rod binding domain-containing protein
MNQVGNLPNMIGSGIENYGQSKVNGSAEGAESRIASLGTEFEGVFLSLMLKEMRNTLEDGGFFGEETSDTYGGMFDMFIGQDMAAASPLGIAEMMLENYSKYQDAATKQATSLQPGGNESAANNASSSTAAPTQISITI